jgi:hypothetical protein
MTLVPRVLLSATLAGPAPSGSAGASRLRRGCSHLPRRFPDQAAPSFAALLRQGQRWKVSHLHSNQQRLTAHEDQCLGWRLRHPEDAPEARALDGDLCAATECPARGGRPGQVLQARSPAARWSGYRLPAGAGLPTGGSAAPGGLPPVGRVVRERNSRHCDPLSPPAVRVVRPKGG